MRSKPAALQSRVAHFPTPWPAARPTLPAPQMKHVADAISEMFNTGHMRMLCRACRLEKLLLAAIYLETVSRWGGHSLPGEAWVGGWVRWSSVHGQACAGGACQSDKASKMGGPVSLRACCLPQLAI